MVSNLERAPLGALLTGGVRHGIYKSLDSFGSGTRVLKMGVQYSEDRIGSQEMPRTHITEDEFQRFRVHEGDLLFSRTSMMSDGAGKCSIAVAHAEPFIFDGNILCCTIDKSKAEPSFVYYFFKSPGGKRSIGEIIAGTQARSLSGSNLAGVMIPLPSLPEQKAIAAVLGALDDKIELNRRMNATLEAIVQSAFKSWFTDVAQNGLPQAWHEGTLGEIAENSRQGIQPNQIEAKTPYIALEHIPRHCISLSEWGKADSLESSKFEFKRGDILFGKLRPYFHKVGIAAIDGVCSTDILVIRPKKPEWFGFVLGHVASVDLVNYADAGSTGTKMPRTSWKELARFEVALPPENLAADFTKRIRPPIDRIISNIHESRMLASLRDTLLPRLLSGELLAPVYAREQHNVLDAP